MLKIPVKMEISVVLPHPEGPTIIVISPVFTVKSIPCRTRIFLSPAGNSLTIFFASTAITIYSYPLNTIAGSIYKTLLMLAKLAIKIITKTATALITITSGGRTIPFRAVMFLVL